MQQEITADETTVEQLDIKSDVDELPALAPSAIELQTELRTKTYTDYSAYGEFRPDYAPLSELNSLIYRYNGSVDALPCDLVIVPTLEATVAGSELAVSDTMPLTIDGVMYVFVRIPDSENHRALLTAYSNALSAALVSGHRRLALPLLAGSPYPTPGSKGYPLAPGVHAMLQSLRSFCEQLRPCELDALFVCATSDRAAKTIDGMFEQYFPIPETEVAAALAEQAQAAAAAQQRQQSLYAKSQPKAPKKKKAPVKKK